MSNTTTEAPGSETSVLMLASRHLAELKESHPEWYADYEDSDPITASREDIDRLLSSCPSEFVQGLLVGIMMFRQQMSIITGRTF